MEIVSVGSIGWCLTMTMRTLLAMVAILIGATVSTATAQTTKPKPMYRRDPLTGRTVLARPAMRSHSSVLGRRITRGLPAPPPPRIGSRLTHRGTNRATSSALTPYNLINDPTGRHDKSGHSTKFYPSARGAMPGQSQQASAAKPRPDTARKDNPNRDPYKALEQIENSGAH